MKNKKKKLSIMIMKIINKKIKLKKKQLIHKIHYLKNTK